MAIIKPNLTRIWADDAAGVDVVDPDVETPGKFALGWGAEKPPYQFFNFMQKLFTQGLGYFDEQGIGFWNTDTDYQDLSLTKGSNGRIYLLKVSSDGTIDPVSDGGTNWTQLPTREEVDAKANQATTYTETEVNNLLDAKADLFTIAKVFKKSNSSNVLFTKTGNFTATTSQEFYAEVGGSVLTIVSGTAITMPTATTGTDYAVWLKTDGTLEATTSFTSPPATDARKIGGFHYAPGSNASAQAGGNSTPQINEYSFWDLNYRPACNDPRGMTCVAGSFWSDIYFLNTNPDVNGTSKYGVTIADGDSPPIIPLTLGGNGSTTFGSLTWFESMSIATAMGKRAFTQSEFMTAMYGVTEGTSCGTDPGTTGLDAPRTSRWGVMQATGNLYIWAADRGGLYKTAGWDANTEGFGSEYNAPNASLLGANWSLGVIAGSRSSFWSSAASFSAGSISLRCACDHLQLE